MAQRGLRHTLRSALRRLRTGNVSTAIPANTPFHARHPFDDQTGVDTSGYLHGSQLLTGHEHDLYSNGYYGTAPSLVKTVLQHWRDTPGTQRTEDYTFIDLGAGKGRVVLLAAEQPFRKCIGVELNPTLHAIAEKNARLWRSLGRAFSPMEMLCADAAAVPFPPGPCVVYLFNPFAAKVLDRLLNNMEATFAHRPGELDILYVNAEFRSQFHYRERFRLLWQHDFRMSPENAEVDLLYSTDANGQRLYAPGQGPCCAWRFLGAGLV